MKMYLLCALLSLSLFSGPTTATAANNRIAPRETGQTASIRKFNGPTKQGPSKFYVKDSGGAAKFDCGSEGTPVAETNCTGTSSGLSGTQYCCQSCGQDKVDHSLD